MSDSATKAPTTEATSDPPAPSKDSTQPSKDNTPAIDSSGKEDASGQSDGIKKNDPSPNKQQSEAEKMDVDDTKEPTSGESKDSKEESKSKDAKSEEKSSGEKSKEESKSKDAKSEEKSSSEKPKEESKSKDAKSEEKSSGEKSKTTPKKRPHEEVTDDKNEEEKEAEKTPTRPAKRVKVSKEVTKSKSYGFGKPGVLCDICFLEEEEDTEDAPFVKCSGCQLLVHSECYSPSTEVDASGHFLCDVCDAVKKGEPPSKQKEVTPKKKGRSPTPVKSPGPLPKKVEAKDDGRLHKPNGAGLDIYCQLCLRRDVAGGMKPTDTGTWVHLTCTMSTTDIYVKDGLMTGTEKALKKSAAQVRATERGGIKVQCEACSVPGGLLIPCAHKSTKTSKKEVPEPPCTKYLHPLCAELTDRVRVIKHTRVGDIVHFKCAVHSFEEKCKLCNSVERQNEMLECEECRNGFHMGCLSPPLEEVPEGDWFCPDCLSKKNKKEEKGDDKEKKEEKESDKEKMEVEKDEKKKDEDTKMEVEKVTKIEVEKEGNKEKMVVEEVEKEKDEDTKMVVEKVTKIEVEKDEQKKDKEEEKSDKEKEEKEKKDS